MAESADELKLQIKIFTKRLNTYAKEILNIKVWVDKTKKDPELKNVLLVKMTSTRSSLENYLKTWDRLEVFYIKLGDDEAFPTVSDSSNRSTILDTVHEAEALVLDLQEDRPSQSSTGSIVNDSKIVKSSLPNISLPQFSGDIKSWVHFRDTYRALVHNEASLTGVEKFHYLLSSLSGDARSVVCQFQVTETNYQLAWDVLMKTYNNNRVLAYSYLEKIVNYRSEKSYSALSNFLGFNANVADNIAALRALHLKDMDDIILCFLALRALDNATRHKFELAHIGTEFPSIDELLKFVRYECQALKLSSNYESFSPQRNAQNTSTTPRFSQNWSKPSPGHSRFPSRSSNRYNPSFMSSSNIASGGTLNQQDFYTNKKDVASSHRHASAQMPSASSPGASTGRIASCPFCSNQHHIHRCANFAQLQPSKRFEFISTWKGCHNCLRSSHSTKDCPSKRNCRFCKQRHHSLIHQFDSNEPQPEHSTAIKSSEPTSQASQQSFHTFSEASEHQVLLGTALVHLKDKNNVFHTVRALLDSGSTRSFITKDCVRRLKLPIHQTPFTVSGGSISTIPVLGQVRCTLHSRYEVGNFIPLYGLIIPRITEFLPLSNVPHQICQDFRRFNLADPEFGTPREIDILLGADVWNLIVIGIPRQLHPNQPYATATIFGNVISGSVSSAPTAASEVALLSVSSPDIQAQLKRFWELEEPLPASRQSMEELTCEHHFLQTYSRTASGRYIVRLPFKLSPDIGNNRSIAYRRFLHLERKLIGNPVLYKEYRTFMQDYEVLHHMSTATSPSSYIIPHHAIVKDKIRVVFDGSCGSTTSSLNELLFSGPKLQSDIAEVLLRFRFHVIAIVTDLVKMYRQILIHRDDSKFQHIFWRFNPQDELVEFELNTVTYGVKPSAFLAIRVLQQLAADEGDKFPDAAHCILHDMYVDDVVTGANSEEEARRLCGNLISCFASGGFTLDKWASNAPEILPQGISSCSDRKTIEPFDTPTIKVLGLVWDPNKDEFAYSVCPPHNSEHTTKRIVLSTIARIFDPLGFLAPVVLSAKLFLQQLWLLNLDWDAPIDTPFLTQWLTFTSQWSALEQITISRYIPLKEALHCQLIGFCDASAKAYSAVFYLRLELPSGNVEVRIIKGKTKVAPTKYHSIARLELCGALLLSRLYSSLNFSSQDSPKSTYLFTDSSVVLAWLHTPSHLLKTFEANRTTTILENTSITSWYHIRSKDNPADIASRGLLPSEILNHSLWWSGPKWLTHPPSHWPSSRTTLKEPALVTTKRIQDEPQPEPEWLLRFSSFRTLQRTLARILRRFRYGKSATSESLAVTELLEARYACIKMVQKLAFPEGPQAHSIQNLCPYFDEHGILRVGGRLHHAPIPVSSRHPIILPSRSHLTKLIVDETHTQYYHAGPSLTLALLRNQYWIPSAMRYVKSRLRICMVCRRRWPKSQIPIMAPLPTSRFSQTRAFIQVGVDFAGPFNLRDSLRRKPTITKAYLCLFVCLATKALHLEAVTSLTTEAFLATFDRFIARRGLPAAMHSDNGRNFLGASRYLKDIFSFINKTGAQISSYMAQKSIAWHFTPPLAPHFGGIWEAGVKSVKKLLPTSVGSHPMTYEELSTVFAKIEALLNSRPLCPLTEDIHAFEVLTPGHFLIGSSMHALPNEDLKDINTNRLSRWELVQNRVQHIWSRWSSEYLHTLQQRHKWSQPGSTVHKNMLCVLLDEKTSLGQWPLARIVDTHPGPDGVIRVVTIRTSSGTELRRAVKSIAPLPVMD